MAVYVARLSLENLRLAKAELLSIIEGEGLSCKILKEIGEFLIMELSERDADLIAKRAALIKEIGRLVYIGDLNTDDIINVVNREGLVVGRVESVRSVAKDLTKKVYDELKAKKKFNPSSNIALVFVNGHLLIYLFVKPGRERRFSARSPQKRPVYLPGTMTPWLARVFVNLAAVSSRKHEVLLDPFCGVGGFALEAGIQGIRIVCGDIDRRMVEASIVNVRGYNLDHYCDTLVMDAAQQSFRSQSFDGISTDPPYGRMTIPQRYDLRNLIMHFLDEAVELVKRGRRIVFAVPVSIDGSVSTKLRELEVKGEVKVEDRVLQYVHSSLTRVVYVVKRL